MRKFEVCSKYADKGINLPERKTKLSAGYDLEAAQDFLLPPHSVHVVPTGLKVRMEDDEYLQVTIRSGIAKNLLILVNGVGIIDADYYNNPDNEGEIGVIIGNIGNSAYQITKGQRIAQGIFLKYGKIEEDKASAKRVGGMGSTGK